MGGVKVPNHAYLTAICQIAFVVLFAVFVRYSPDTDARFNPISNNETADYAHMHHLEAGNGDAHKDIYPMFQDVHVMIFIGFGFLMTFLKRYGFSSVGLNFLIAALALQWAILVNGFFHLHDGVILVDLMTLLGADFTAAAVLISFGAVLGKTTPTQLIMMTLIEIPVFAINEVIGRRYLGAVDMGDSMFVHAFGAYFGLAVSLAINREDASTPKEGSSYRSDLFAMIGTVFLWLYWPSFNAAAAPGDDQHRAIVNTYLALCSCTLMAFAVSSLVDRKRRFDMVHIQNSTLAGGVAIGAAADLMIQPWGAILVGMIAGFISVMGYAYLTPFLARKLKIHDTCGVHNLHGMPGVIAGIVGAIMAALATEAEYGVSLYQIYPELAPKNGTAELEQIHKYLPDIAPAGGLTGVSQGLNQILALAITLAFAIVGGVFTGFVLRFAPFQKLKTEDLYEDAKHWLLEEGEESGSEAGDHHDMITNVSTVRSE